MSDKGSIATQSTEAPVSVEALETSRLLVEFLHAAYATRHLDQSEPDKAHGTASVDVSTHAVRAAIHVNQHGERTVGQLASGMGISYGWASRVVDELEAAGYLIRERDTSDRRVVRVRLNPERREEVERSYQWHGAAVEEALEPLNESQRESVRQFLRRITELLVGGPA
jgi:DNA-binding MarR family transcriptional regulator